MSLLEEKEQKHLWFFSLQKLFSLISKTTNFLYLYKCLVHIKAQFDPSSRPRSMSCFPSVDTNAECTMNYDFAIPSPWSFAIYTVKEQKKESGK